MALVANARWVNNARSSGGTYADGYPWRIVLHTIEGSSTDGLAAGHQYPPHVWYDPATRVLLQTVPFDRSSFALYSDGVTPTNKARALQVEISGRAQDTPQWPGEWLDNLTADVIVPMCQFVAAQGGSIDLADVPLAGPIPGSASASAPQRMSLERWATFRGICGHRHVPTNDHWDPGAMNVERIAQHAAYLIGSLLEQPAVTPEIGDSMPSLLCQMGQSVFGCFAGIWLNISGPEWEAWKDKVPTVKHTEAEWTTLRDKWGRVR
jgi:hypothetical protein